MALVRRRSTREPGMSSTMRQVLDIVEDWTKRTMDAATKTLMQLSDTADAFRRTVTQWTLPLRLQSTAYYDQEMSAIARTQSTLSRWNVLRIVNRVATRPVSYASQFGRT